MKFWKMFCLLSCFTIPSNLLAIQIARVCVSESGRSTYSIILDTEKRDGYIRYQYLNQDVLYRASLEKFDRNLVSGVASFKESKSGETRANPFEFRFSLDQNVFEELNVKAKCN